MKLNHGPDQSFDLFFGQESYLTVHQSPGLKEKQSGRALDGKPSGGYGVGVHIQLGKLDPAVVLLGQLLQDGHGHAAVTAMGPIAVQDYRPGKTQDLRHESPVENFHGVIGEFSRNGQGVMTAAAKGTVVNPLPGNTILGPAMGAGQDKTLRFHFFSPIPEAIGLNLHFNFKPFHLKDKPL
jgi:hypothetical protein